MEKGFGFITPGKGGEDLFAHAYDLRDGDVLVEGTAVRYTEFWDEERAKYRAKDVTGCGWAPKGKDGKEICRQYMRWGKCEWGDSCRRDHETPPEQAC